jgi:DNA/RNA endonuclease G (NUC1)
MKKLKENLIINNSAVKVVVNKIILNKKEFNLLTKPIMYYWFYLSKQNIYLKNIINCVKKEKIKKNCEFCNMDIELEALERKDFQELTNEFRVLNVNKAFDAQSFLEFYRLNQKYITICIECK